MTEHLSRSVCCGAPVHTEIGDSHFIGARVEVDGVAYLGQAGRFVCDACAEPCELEEVQPDDLTYMERDGGE